MKQHHFLRGARIYLSGPTDLSPYVPTRKSWAGAIAPALSCARQDSFKAFEQGESASRRQFGGLGLGLAIAKNLVDLYGG